MGETLVLNSGSSSIKFALFDENLSKKTHGSATEIGGASMLSVDGVDRSVSLTSHVDAMTVILKALQEKGVDPSSLAAAGHRVVHGGPHLTKPCRLGDGVLEEIERCTPLAPLHNPHNLSAIRALAQIAPDLPQCASFDTAFHTSNPDVARRYALPQEVADPDVLRYGFHGISYAAMVRKLPDISGRKLPERLLALHLGNGASLCAIRNGRSVATTMGYSPIEGLTMGTRVGSIDANLVLRLAGQFGVERTGEILNNESGLLGLGGTSDMRGLHAESTSRSQFAIEHFCYWAVRHAGSMISAMEGLDGIAFTGGIGENDADIRGRILKGLAWAGASLNEGFNEAGQACLSDPGATVSTWIVPAEEEWMIACDALSVMEPA